MFLSVRQVYSEYADASHCVSWAARHFGTFDGKSFTFPGTWTYTLVQEYVLTRPPVYSVLIDMAYDCSQGPECKIAIKVKDTASVSECRVTPTATPTPPLLWQPSNFVASMLLKKRCQFVRLALMLEADVQTFLRFTREPNRACTLDANCKLRCLSSIAPVYKSRAACLM